MSRLSFEDAMDIADSMDLPDGAFWAMSHELAGLEYGAGFPSVAPTKRKSRSARKLAKIEARERPRSIEKPHRCGTCGKDFATRGAKKRHRKDAHKPEAPA